MKRILLFAIPFGLVAVVGLCSAEGVGHTEQGTSVQQAPALRFDGLYFADKGYYHSYMKFSADGTVVDGHGEGIWNNPAKVSSSGRYEIHDSKITFTLHSSQGKVDYEGTIEKHALKLQWYSHINQSRGESVYRLMTVRESTEGLILSFADKDARPTAKPSVTGPAAASSKFGVSSTVVARKVVSLKAGNGLIQRIHLTNSRSDRAFGCVLGTAPTPSGWTSAAVLWELEARGKPGWGSGEFSIRDDNGHEFIQFCTRNERNVKGVFYTETVFIGPLDAKKLTVTYENLSVTVLVPAK